VTGMEITIRDVYQRVTEIGQQLGKFAGHLESVDTRLEAGQSKMADHETRLRTLEARPTVPETVDARLTALEKLAWKLVGAFAAVNAIAVAAEWFLFAHK
jgi:phage shock protein A